MRLVVVNTAAIVTTSSTKGAAKHTLSNRSMMPPCPLSTLL